MAGGCAPLLQVDVSPWLVPVSFRLVLLSFLMAGGCVPMAGAGILQAGVVVLPGGRGCVPVAGAGILPAGVVVLPGGWWMCPRGWWCLLASSAAYCSRAPRQGHAPTPQRGGHSPSKSKFQRNKNERLLLYISII